MLKRIIDLREISQSNNYFVMTSMHSIFAMSTTVFVIEVTLMKII